MRFLSIVRSNACGSGVSVAACSQRSDHLSTENLIYVNAKDSTQYISTVLYMKD